MKTYDEIMNETERKTVREHEAISMRIIKELESYYKIDFHVYENNITYSVLIHAMLFDPSFIEYRPKLLEILEKYNVNEENIISRFLIALNQAGIPYNTKYFIEESLRSLPYCKSFKKFSDGYVIETRNAMVEAYQLSESVDNTDLWILLNQNVFQKHCHEAVEFCSKYFPDEYIVTSELKSLFGGTYYHSYFKGKNKEEVYDIAASILYKENTFDTFYKPSELQKIPSSRLNEYLEELPEEKERNYCKVLRLAIENKIRMEKES